MGLVGVNGAGKSTLFKALMGFIPSARGKISLLGYSVKDALKSNLIAYVPQSEEVDWDFPVLVKDVVLMIYREDYGQKVRKRRFLRQFLGKTIEDPIQVNNDITSLSGATISSYSIATGVKRVLLKLHTLKDKIQSMN